MTRCPCTSGATFDDCCGPILAGDRRAGTAEALMRSRFTAFAVNDADYLVASWHPETRPETLTLDESITWHRLDIRTVSGGSPFETDGEVAFVAHYRSPAGRGILQEHSRFRRIDGRWFYLDGVVA